MPSPLEPQGAPEMPRCPGVIGCPEEAIALGSHKEPPKTPRCPGGPGVVGDPEEAIGVLRGADRMRIRRLKATVF